MLGNGGSRTPGTLLFRIALLLSLVVQSEVFRIPSIIGKMNGGDGVRSRPLYVGGSETARSAPFLGTGARQKKIGEKAYVAAAARREGEGKGGRGGGGGGKKGGGGRGGGGREDRDRTFVPVSTRWRMLNVEVPLDSDPGKDDVGLHKALLERVAKLLKLDDKDKDSLLLQLDEDGDGDGDDEDQDTPPFRAKVVRKAFDGRWKKNGQPQFVYTIDISFSLDMAKQLRLRPQEGRLDPAQDEEETAPPEIPVEPSDGSKRRKRVVVIGAGPAGLFAALKLAEAGVSVIILERGQPVEKRGKDIGALFNRKVLNRESNLCYGEGGAGTWSDGKLTTRIGKNSAQVRSVLKTLVDHGAPERILVDGKPHLGTDRLVRILRQMREHLQNLGCEFRFGTRVDDLLVTEGKVAGVLVRTLGVSASAAGAGAGAGANEPEAEKIDAELVCLAVGHSARRLYERLIDHKVRIDCKPIAVGFRVEHPQELINKIQFGKFGELCARGKGPVPVADYRLAAEVDLVKGTELIQSTETTTKRSCYSFCMCPGGQIVPTSVNPDELCINGMSFSKRQSQWANSALVVSVNPEDMELLHPGQGPLKGVIFQETIERKAAQLGGGNLVAPVQRLTDFIAGVPTVLPAGAPPLSSSYRMGIKPAPCHEIYPAFVTEALRKALLKFDREMPGFICDEALLHGVETRTSAPVQIVRSPDTLECVSLSGLFPAGEGAGYAGGIVSAAVDGIKVGQKIVEIMSQSPWREKSSVGSAPTLKLTDVPITPTGNKVLNPATGRLVSANGAIGKRLVKENRTACL